MQKVANGSALNWKICMMIHLQKKGNGCMRILICGKKNPCMDDTGIYNSG